MGNGKIHGSGKTPPTPKSEEITFEESEVTMPSQTLTFEPMEIKGRIRADKQLAHVTKPPKANVTLGNAIPLYTVKARNKKGQYVDVHVTIAKNMKDAAAAKAEGFTPLARDRVGSSSLAPLPKGEILIQPAERQRID